MTSRCGSGSSTRRAARRSGPPRVRMSMPSIVRGGARMPERASQPHPGIAALSRWRSCTSGRCWKALSRPARLRTGMSGAARTLEVGADCRAQQCLRAMRKTVGRPVRFAGGLSQISRYWTARLGSRWHRASRSAGPERSAQRSLRRTAGSNRITARGSIVASHLGS